jgi:hypothetical protein
MNRPTPRAERPKVTHVTDLSSALDAYWTASSRREDQAAYHEILLFGGPDGYPSHGKARTAVIRWLRQLALWIERE